MKDRVPEEVDCNLLAVMTGMEDRLLSSAARRRIGIPDAEDALQEARLRSLVACRNRTLPDDPSALKGWFCKVFWREVARVCAKRTWVAQDGVWSREAGRDPTATPEALAETRLAAAEIWESMPFCPGERRAVRRILLQGVPASTAAREAKVGLRTMQKRIARFRIALVAELTGR